MVQILIVPPLLIKAIPWWVWKRIIELPAIQPVFNFFTKPIFALTMFNGLFSFYHIPDILDFLKYTPLFYSSSPDSCGGRS